MEDLELELKGLRLDMIDRLSNYDITVREIIPYDEELRAISKLPEEKRAKQFNRLADKIRTACIGNNRRGKAELEGI